MDELIIKYLTNRISDREMDELILWLNESEENRDLFFDLKSIYETKNAGQITYEVDHIWHRISSVIEPDDAPFVDYESKYRNTKRYLIISGIAAFLLILLMALPYSKFFDKEDVQQRFSEITVPVGRGVVKLALVDGTIVELKGNSKLKYPQDFNGDNREVYLDGEAFFDVAKDEGKTFTVKTSSQNIEVLGTYFYVRDHRSERLSNVTLVKGRVNLFANETQYALNPNQSVVVDKMKNTSHLISVPNRLSRALFDKKYHFKDKLLSQILDDIEILYGVDVSIANKSIAKTRYTGTFSLNQDIHEILSIINYKKQFQYMINNNQEVIITGS